MPENRLDFLIFGATGFTGLHCIPYMYKFAKKDGRDLTWGIAGRSEEKLRQVLTQISSEIGVDLSSIPIVCADIKSDESLLRMAQQTKILINCCGPYRLLGEPVVKACIEAGTHCVDVSGEPSYIESTLENYNEAACNKGVYIVSACGVGSIPNDIGLVFVKNQFEGTLNSLVSYIQMWTEGENIPGPTMNYGTWESAIYAFEHESDIKSIKKKLFPEGFRSFKPTLKTHIVPHKPHVLDGWALLFPGGDRSIMERTERYFYENENKRPVQVDTQLVLKSFLNVLGLLFASGIWFLLAKFKCGRNLLLNYPHIFTGGMFRKDQNPSEEKIKNTIFRLTFYGEGWKEKQENRDNQYSELPNKCIVARIKGKNPAYGITCASVVGAAFVIATEKDKLPKKGGVYTSGIAFAKTSLIQLLHNNGLTFEVISQKNL